MTANRRTATRHDVELDATLTIAGGSPEPCRIVNLGLGGAFIAERKLPMGSRVRLAFKLQRDEAVDCPGTVRWGNLAGCGVQFDGLRARETWALGKYLESLS